MIEIIEICFTIITISFLKGCITIPEKLIDTSSTTTTTQPITTQGTTTTQGTPTQGTTTTTQGTTTTTTIDPSLQTNVTVHSTLDNANTNQLQFDNTKDVNCTVEWNDIYPNSNYSLILYEKNDDQILIPKFYKFGINHNSYIFNIGKNSNYKIDGTYEFHVYNNKYPSLSPGIVSLSISTGLNSVINILKYKIFVQNFSLILKDEHEIEITRINAVQKVEDVYESYSLNENERFVIYIKDNITHEFFVLTKTKPKFNINDSIVIKNTFLTDSNNCTFFITVQDMKTGHESIHSLQKTVRSIKKIPNSKNYQLLFKLSNKNNSQNYETYFYYDSYGRLSQLKSNSNNNLLHFNYEDNNPNEKYIGIYDIKYIHNLKDRILRPNYSDSNPDYFSYNTLYNKKAMNSTLYNTYISNYKDTNEKLTHENINFNGASFESRELITRYEDTNLIKTIEIYRRSGWTYDKPNFPTKRIIYTYDSDFSLKDKVTLQKTTLEDDDKYVTKVPTIRFWKNKTTKTITIQIGDMNITEVVSKINNNIKDNKLTYKIDESDIKSYLYYIFKTDRLNSNFKCKLVYNQAIKGDEDSASIISNNLIKILFLNDNNQIMLVFKNFYFKTAGIKAIKEIAFNNYNMGVTHNLKVNDNIFVFNSNIGTTFGTGDILDDTSANTVIDKSSSYFSVLYPNGIPTLQINAYKNRQLGTIVVSSIIQKEYIDRNIFI